ncbi:MAG TPA: ParA family protein [Egibacteraceae bacterium]|nr:ParA family protein [Egibacteraceae bacterium]
MLDNCVAVVNGKGGVGKTSIVANVAATAALGGWRTLAVDLDPQGNLARDLGYRDRSDEGRGLLEAVMTATPARPMTGVRPGLDVITGGRHTRRLGDLLVVQALGQQPAVDYHLEPALAAVAGRYDLVLLDCPPASNLLVRAALALAGHAVIPTKIDDASIDGLEGLADVLGEVVRTANPQLRVLGVVLFDVGAGDTRLQAEARRELEEMLDGIAPVLRAAIRHTRRAARDLRRRGSTAAEYEQAALDAKPWYADRAAPALSRAAGGLAGDYQQLTTEILAALCARAAGQIAEVTP